MTLYSVDYDKIQTTISYTKNKSQLYKTIPNKINIIFINNLLEFSDIILENQHYIIFLNYKNNITKIKTTLDDIYLISYDKQINLFLNKTSNLVRLIIHKDYKSFFNLKYLLKINNKLEIQKLNKESLNDVLNNCKKKINLEKSKYFQIDFINKLESLDIYFEYYKKLEYIVYLLVKTDKNLLNYPKILSLIYFYSNKNHEFIQFVSEFINIEYSIDIENYDSNELLYNEIFYNEIILKSLQIKYILGQKIILFEKVKDYIDKLKFINKSCNKLLLNTNDMNLICITCNLKGHFVNLLNYKYTICKICFNHKLSEETKEIKRNKIIQYEKKLRENGYNDEDIFNLRNTNS